MLTNALGFTGLSLTFFGIMAGWARANARMLRRWHAIDTLRPTRPNMFAPTARGIGSSKGAR